MIFDIPRSFSAAEQMAKSLRNRRFVVRSEVLLGSNGMLQSLDTVFPRDAVDTSCRGRYQLNAPSDFGLSGMSSLAV